MINIDKPKEQTLIVVAMSGGVDSSTVAAMLHSEGYKVIGVTLQLYDHGVAIGKKGACCAGQDIYDARTVADRLGIPHYVLDYESKFKESVITKFADSYLRGETPLPCVECNQSVKFNDLLQVAKNLGADGLATGHYVRKVNGENGPELHTGIDLQKDQSYFLFATTLAQLDYIYFPLGSLTKQETRSIAAKYQLITADKPDSQDICFVPNGNYRKIILDTKPEAACKGKIIHVDGFQIGEHDGIINFTIGQRKGLGISYKEPLYVVKIDPLQQIVYVGPESDLMKVEFVIKDINWLKHFPLSKKIEVTTKIRSTRPRTLAWVTKISESIAKITLMTPEKAITPGQACVLYQEERVLGGGWITNEIF